FLRRLPVHQVLRLVVGQHAEVPVLSGRGIDRIAGAHRVETGARQRSQYWRTAVIRQSHRTFLGTGSLLIVLVNAVILAGVARNRAAPPVSEFTLTEREVA